MEIKIVLCRLYVYSLYYVKIRKYPFHVLILQWHPLNVTNKYNQIHGRFCIYLNIDFETQVKFFMILTKLRETSILLTEIFLFEF